MPIRQTLRNIILHDSMKMTRLGLAFGSLFWAIQLALPTALFPSAVQLLEGKGRTTYAYMAVIAPEEVWAALFLVNAVWTFYSLLSGERNALTLALDGFLGCILWTGSTVACYYSYWQPQLTLFEALSVYQPPAAMSGEAVMALYSWWHMVRYWAEEPTNKRV